MKKIFLSAMVILVIGLLSGCMITDNNYDEYERKQFQSTDTISEIVVTDESANIVIQTKDSNEILVEYSDSPTNSWYRIDVSNGVLKIEKTRGTVGVDDNTLIITLPQKEYESISVETTNGDIQFDNVASSVYKCSTKNGDIKGSLAGNENDYLIVTTAKNGESTLENNVIESSKIVEFDVENGDIKVKFSE